MKTTSPNEATTRNPDEKGKKEGERIHRSLKQNTNKKDWELDEIILKSSQL